MLCKNAGPKGKQLVNTITNTRAMPDSTYPRKPARKAAARTSHTEGSSRHRQPAKSQKPNMGVPL